MKLIPSPPLKSVAALAAVAVFTCMLAASPVRAGAFEEYRAVDMKLQSVREGDAEGLRAAGVLARVLLEALGRRAPPPSARWPPT